MVSRKLFLMIVNLDEKKIGRQLSQIKSTKATKIQELKVLTDAIQKARDTDEDEVKQKAKDR